MYIKAENKIIDRHKENPELINSSCVENNNENNGIDNVVMNDVDSNQTKDKLLACKIGDIPDNISNESITSNVRPRIIGSPVKQRQLYSLKFLHKPKRVEKFNSDRFPDDILQRNTDLNKQISLELPPLSPKSTSTSAAASTSHISIGTGSFNNYTINSNNSYTIDANPSTDSLLAFPHPVYKKSGELVRSSLKGRSKSLPSTPAAETESDNSKAELLNNPRKLLRSKSVHFDQRAPVKYFLSDESPMNVYSKDEFEELLKYTLLKNKNKSKFPSDNNSDDDDENIYNDYDDYEDEDEEGKERLLFKFNELVLEEKKKLLKNALISNNNSKTESSSNNNNNNNSAGTLRKSKRFQNALNKSPNKKKETGTCKTVRIPQESQIKVSSDSLSETYNKLKGHTNNSIKEIENKLKTRASVNTINKIRTNRVVGLYNQNFPILSNKNPKSLKLNIFVSLSRDKKVFLQEISLHINQRKYTTRNLSYPVSITNTTRYLLGKVMVKNIFFDKRVAIRYTWDGWVTTNEVECIWLSSGDSILPGTNMDVFHFLIDDTNKIDTVGKLEFCIHYRTRDDQNRQEFWDNNDGENYKVEVVMNGFNNPFGK